MDDKYNLSLLLFTIGVIIFPSFQSLYRITELLRHETKKCLLKIVQLERFYLSFEQVENKQQDKIRITTR